jgi:serine/threonine protein phosphatase 1
MLFSNGLPRPKVDPNARVYAIGDVHGRCDLMLDMLGEIVEDFERRRDGRRCEIVFLGDYIDRGDSSRAVLEALMKLMDGKSDEIIALRGNHEEALLDFLRSPLQNRPWLEFGARQTLADYGVVQPPREPSEESLMDLRDALKKAMGDHVDFLESLPFHATSGDAIFTHAGIAPDDAETLEDRRAMMWGHVSSKSDWPVPGRLVVHGHYDAPEPADRPGRVCVDTGAYYTGRLTAARLDDDCCFISVQR